MDYYDKRIDAIKYCGIETPIIERVGIIAYYLSIHKNYKKNNGVHSIIEGIIDFLILTIVVIVSLIIMEKKECLI